MTLPSSMIALIGEQPIPTLLPVLHLKPTKVLLIHTKLSEVASKRLKARLEVDNISIEQLFIRDPYDIHEVYQSIVGKLTKLQWVEKDLLINITGGTKPMSTAAYQFAMTHQCPIIYLQSEKQQTRLYHYNFNTGIAELEQNELLPELIKIDDYLNAYLPGYQVVGFSKNQYGKIDTGGRFEKIVHDTLKPHVDEVIAGVKPKGVKNQIEIDLVIRDGNQVGIAEIKTGGADKRGLDQLSTAGGRAYLGTYTAKFWVIGARNLRSELRALANAQNINVIHLPGYNDGKRLNSKETNLLINTVLEKLGNRKR